MQLVTIFRVDTSGPATLGVMTINGQFYCLTLERPWLDNMRQLSCIPAGTYRCVPYSSKKYKDVWEVTGVIGRSKILIHAGNKVDDTMGCILVGYDASKAHENYIGNSTAALNGLRKIIGISNSFTLVVRDVR